ncbi:MAG: 30S ribosomal protein S20 [bacterium]|nr:30S ribosomal protein S20 [bacterium]
MAITKSAKKAWRTSLRKKVFNDKRKTQVKKAIKKVQKLLNEKNVDEARKFLSSAYKALDKAAKGNTIKKGKAARKKSRLAKMLNKAG